MGKFQKLISEIRRLFRFVLFSISSFDQAKYGQLNLFLQLHKELKSLILKTRQWFMPKIRIYCHSLG